MHWCDPFPCEDGHGVVHPQIVAGFEDDPLQKMSSMLPSMTVHLHGKCPPESKTNIIMLKFLISRCMHIGHHVC